MIDQYVEAYAVVDSSHLLTALVPIVEACVAAVYLLFAHVNIAAVGIDTHAVLGVYQL